MIKRIINTGPQETDQGENQEVEDSFSDSDELVARAELIISINEASEEDIIVISELKEICDLGENADGMIFKKADFKRLNAAIRRANNILRFFETFNITETNLIVASSVWVPRQLRLKKAKRDGKTKSEQWWKRRITHSIKKLNRYINLLTRHRNSQVKSVKKAWASITEA